ncbi:MAG TPA: ABC transporter permease [Acidimicrobiales bacterium]|nr:ABC transporter permease [Acidimicrobiales bacterium]
MLRFALKRLASMVVVLFVVSALTFVIFQAMPNGNPALRMAGRTATQANIEAITKQFGFNKPIYVQYWRTMQQIFTGQISSYVNGQVNVLGQIKADLPVTLSLVLGAFVIWFVVSVILGLIGGYRAGKGIDTAITTFNFAGISAPVFVIGDILIYLFAFKTHIFPASGYVGIANPLGWAWHLVLPWISLAILYIGIYSQVLRSRVVDALGEDFVRTARAKGLSARRIALHHVLRTSLIPVVALSGLDIAGVLGGGAILTETVFNLPGVGYYAGTSIASLDVPPVMVITIFGAFLVVLFSAFADILYAVLDPRIRAAG